MDALPGAAVPAGCVRIDWALVRLPDRPKRNQEGSGQLHGIVTTLSRLAHGWEPYRPGRIQKARSIEACSDHASRMDMAFSTAWMIARCGSGLNFWRVLD